MSELILSVALAYLIGSMPVAWLVAKVRTGQDIRTLGSGNVGVMNTAVSISRAAGLVVLLAEAAKGVVPVVLARQIAGTDVAVGLSALAAVSGTRWSIWLKGAGGRGNTATVTAIAMISWQALAIWAGAWVVLRIALRRAFFATLGAFLALPVVLGLYLQSWWWALVGAAFAAIFLSDHRPGSDDHSLIKQQWPSLTAFLRMPRRK